MNDQLTFTLTREQFEAKRKEAKQSGFDLQGDKGTTPSQHGVTLDYDYVEPTLTITIHANVLVRAFAEKSVRAWLAA